MINISNFKFHGFSGDVQRLGFEIVNAAERESLPDVNDTHRKKVYKRILQKYVDKSTDLIETTYQRAEVSDVDLTPSEIHSLNLMGFFLANPIGIIFRHGLYQRLPGPAIVPILSYPDVAVIRSKFFPTDGSRLSVDIAIHILVGEGKSYIKSDRNYNLLLLDYLTSRGILGALEDSAWSRAEDLSRTNHKYASYYAIVIAVTLGVVSEIYRFPLTVGLAVCQNILVLGHIALDEMSLAIKGQAPVRGL